MAIIYGGSQNPINHLTTFIAYPKAVKQSSPRKKPYEDKGASLIVFTLSVEKTNVTK